MALLKNIYVRERLFRSTNVPHTKVDFKTFHLCVLDIFLKVPPTVETRASQCAFHNIFI